MNLLDQLNFTGLNQYLSYVIVCDHSKGGIGKADAVRDAFPDIQTTSTLWIGDTEVDRDGARYLGCSVCLLSCGLRTKEYLQSLKPDFLSNSINKLDIERIGKINVH